MRRAWWLGAVLAFGVRPEVLNVAAPDGSALLFFTRGVEVTGSFTVITP